MYIGLIIVALLVGSTIGFLATCLCVAGRDGK